MFAVQRICVVVCTFRRPGLLPGLLEALAGQTGAAGPALDCVVVDNDDVPSAEAACRQAASPALQIHYIHEPRRGISHARNAGVGFAMARDFAWVALLDDDEIPDRSWLAELTAAAAATGADAVIGPVLPRFRRRPPAWARTSGLYFLPDYQDGATLQDGLTGNALLRMAFIAGAGLSFEADLGLSGGEDQMFFRSAALKGGRIVFAAKALVWEDVPSDRLTFGYMMRRSYRKGITLGLCDRRLRGGGRTFWPRVAKGLARVALAPAAFAGELAWGVVASLARAAGTVAFGWGMAVGSFGVNYRFYRR